MLAIDSSIVVSKISSVRWQVILASLVLKTLWSVHDRPLNSRSEPNEQFVQPHTLAPGLMVHHPGSFPNLSFTLAKIQEYEDFFLAGQPSSLPFVRELPTDKIVDLVWQSHILSTENYKKACSDKFQMYMHRIYPVDSTEVGCEIMDNASFQVEIQNLPVSKYAPELMRLHPEEFPSCQTFTETVLAYKTFLQQAQKAPTDHICLPTHKVDLLFHAHIIDTLAFMRDSQLIFGFAYNHHPGADFALGCHHCAGDASRLKTPIAVLILGVLSTLS